MVQDFKEYILIHWSDMTNMDWRHTASQLSISNTNYTDSDMSQSVRRHFAMGTSRVGTIGLFLQTFTRSCLVISFATV